MSNAWWAFRRNWRWHDTTSHRGRPGRMHAVGRGSAVEGRRHEGHRWDVGDVVDATAVWSAVREVLQTARHVPARSAKPPGTCESSAFLTRGRSVAEPHGTFLG